MSSPGRQRRRVLAVYALASAAALVLFNVLRTVTDDVAILPVDPWYILPFVTLLAGIAVMPFINREWWEKNYPLVAFALGFVVVVYYAAAVHNLPRLLLTASEYISFISLIGSLFVVAGGIHVRIRGRSTPAGNVALLATGAVLANILGTTGASMVLIRPYLRMNKYRIRPFHVVFFIFVVSNIGGALTPIGDPPLFLGYLKGVPFFWIITRVSEIWALTMAVLLLVFFLIDRRAFAQQSAAVRHQA